MEELVLMILRGLVIGVVVSAPMGPVGIFILQRTLDKGRLSGLFTGVGAAISDLIYCLLTGFGLSFIEGFINDHRSPIQLLGSLVLVGFGMWLIHKKPDGSVAAEADQGAASPEGDILKGFALTFSNPLILFLIIGLFAQFNFVIEGIRFYHYVLGFLGITAGALGWWWMVTYFVDKLRGHFSPKTMKRINTVIGIIIFLFAAYGIVTSGASLMSASDASSAPRPAPGATVSFRVADTAMKGWSVEVSDSSSAGFRLEVGHASRPDPFGDSIEDILVLKGFSLASGDEVVAAEVVKGLDCYRGQNSWRLVRSVTGWSVFAGNREYSHLIDVPVAMGPLMDVQVNESPGGKIDLSAFEIDIPAGSEPRMASPGAMSQLNEGAFGHAELSGLYSLFDYEVDDTYSKIGGQYRLGVVRESGEEDYQMIYLGGARENSGMWIPGMVKGKLVKTPFMNVFDVEWTDAEGGLMLHDVSGEFDPLVGMLTVRFPYQGSVLRFRKE